METRLYKNPGTAFTAVELQASDLNLTKDQFKMHFESNVSYETPLFNINKEQRNY